MVQPVAFSDPQDTPSSATDAAQPSNAGPAISEEVPLPPVPGSVKDSTRDQMPPEPPLSETLNEKKKPLPLPVPAPTSAEPPRQTPAAVPAAREAVPEQAPERLPAIYSEKPAETPVETPSTSQPNVQPKAQPAKPQETGTVQQPSSEATKKAEISSEKSGETLPDTETKKPQPAPKKSSKPAWWPKAPAAKKTTPDAPAPSGAVSQPGVVPSPDAAAKSGAAASRTMEIDTSHGAPVVKSMHVKGLDVAHVLEMLSRETKVNIVISQSVQGSVTLDIRNKTLDETLQIIARQCHLMVKRDGDVIFISTFDEVRQSEEQELPIRLYRLRYVKSTDAQAMIAPHLSTNGKVTASVAADTGLETDISSTTGGGSTTAKAVKAGGNTMAGDEILIVQDYESVLQRIDRLISEIDVQPIQVMIEAVMVQVLLDRDNEVGVNFAALDGTGRAVGVLGSGSDINFAAGFPPSSPVSAGKLASGYLDTTNSMLKVGIVGTSTTAFLELLEKSHETKVLASPRLLVLNKQRAEIHVGRQLGYKTTTTSQTSTQQSVQYMNIGTQLRLRPYVLGDDLIRLEIHPERSTGDLDDQGIPQTNTSQVTTNVMIPNGRTIVIGGLIDTEVVKNWEGIPVLSRIPYLGYLFRHTVDSEAKKELVVILTPYIVNPECPDATNYLGWPRTLKLDGRVGQQRPFPEQLDPPSLYEVLAPDPDECPAPTAAGQESF